MRTRLRWLAIFAAIGLLVAACGSDRGDDDDASPTTTAGTEAGDTTTTAPEGETFGDLPSPCGEGDASTASFRGVTADTIKIGTGDDRGYPSSPGLNEAMGQAVEAMVEWCNEQGGINGRQLEVKNYDAAILNLGNEMLAACSDGIFMLVGQGFSLDSAQEETRIGCELGSVPGFSVSPEFAHGPMMMQSVPNPTDFAPVQIAAYLGEAFPEQAKKSAVMYANYAATEDTKDKVLQTYPPFGFEFLDCPQSYNIGGEDDWTPFVQRLIDCQVELLYFTGSPNPNFQNFLIAAQRLGFDPIYSVDANFYEENFAAWNAQNGGAGDNTYVRMAFVPFEEADSSPAMKQYIDLLTAAGKKPSLLGAQSTASFLLWATAAQACGDELTQDCVFAEIAKLDKWTAGGLHAPTNPATNMPPDCGMVVKLNGGEYERVDPAEVASFDCSPDYVKPVTGPVVERAQLGPDRVSTAYLK